MRKIAEILEKQNRYEEALNIYEEIYQLKESEGVINNQIVRLRAIIAQKQ